jgi:hypothetical protein
LYEGIFTNEINATEALAKIEIEWPADYEIGNTNKPFHEEFEKEWVFKKPAHYFHNKIFFNAHSNVEEGLRKYTDFYEKVDYEDKV